MGKVKMEDIHNLLDLVKEASEKTDLWLSFGISSFGKGKRYMSINFYAHELIAPSQLKTIMQGTIYIGEGENSGEKYVAVREFLKKLIREEKVNA